MPVALTLADASTIRRWRERPDVMVRELFGATPDAWQDEVLREFPRRPRQAMKASKGPGKAQPIDTLIPTPLGERRMGELVPGDEVFAADGSACRVLKVHRRGRLAVFRVTLDDGTWTRACGEHLWRVRGAAERARRHQVPYQRRTQESEIWTDLTTEQILARGVRVKNGRWSGRQFELPQQGAAEFPEAALPLDPYVLGVWLGDGCKGSGRYATKPEPTIAEEIRRRGYLVNYGANQRAATVVGVISKLRQLGVADLGSHERFVPAIYKYGSPAQRADVVRGLMDTDGAIGSEGTMEFGVTSKRLADDFAWLVRSLGGSANSRAVKKTWYRSPKGERIDGRDLYRVGCRLDFNPFLVPHRQRRWRPSITKESRRYFKRYIDAINPDGEAECVCIEIDHPSRCYLTNDFIVTHNSTVLAWLAWNFLLTRKDPKIGAVSVSGKNLQDGLWAEMAKWRNKSPILDQEFDLTTERIFHKGHRDTHFMSARTWKERASTEELGNVLAGLHADNIMFLLDEAGSIPVAILAAAEAALANLMPGNEAHVVMAGNTNLLEGALYHGCVRQARLWHVIEINGDPDNPKRSTRISIDWAREQIAQWGRENPFVKVGVLGQWPEASVMALFSANDVEAAMRRNYPQGEIDRSARLLGVDVARTGLARSVIFPRQGLVAFPPTVMRNVSGIVGAGRISSQWDEWGVDACFVDATGGFGWAWIDQLHQLRRTPTPVQFSEAAEDPVRYVNRRAEMGWRCREWVANGGALPQGCRELLHQLPAINYTYRGERLLLEDKSQIEDRIGDSLDESDGLFLTFASTVAPRQAGAGHVDVPGRARREAEYDPLGDALVGR